MSWMHNRTTMQSIVQPTIQRVGQRDAMLERQPRTRSHLHLIAIGDRDREAGGDRVARAGREGEILGGNDVEPGGTLGGVGGEGKALAVGEAFDGDGDGHGVP